MNHHQAYAQLDRDRGQDTDFDAFPSDLELEMEEPSPQDKGHNIFEGAAPGGVR